MSLTADQVQKGNPPASVSQPDQQPSPDGNGAATAPPTNPLNPPDPSGSSKPTAEKISFLEAVRKLKGELFELLGDEDGGKEYYKLLLATNAVQHSNQITDAKKQGAFYRKLEAMVKLTRENPPKPAAKPFAEALEMARGGYMKLPDDKLVERIEAQMELQKYPDAEDPLAIIPVLTQGGHLELVDAATRLLERKLKIDADDAAAYRASKGA